MHNLHSFHIKRNGCEFCSSGCKIYQILVILNINITNYRIRKIYKNHYTYLYTLTNFLRDIQKDPHSCMLRLNKLPNKSTECSDHELYENFLHPSDFCAPYLVLKQ